MPPAERLTHALYCCAQRSGVMILREILQAHGALQNQCDLRASTTRLASGLDDAIELLACELELPLLPVHV